MKQIIRELKMIKAHNGSLNAKVITTNGDSLYLHSVYNPEKEAQDWLKRVNLQSDTVYIVLGFGLGYHVKALLAALPEHCHIFVIEQSHEESLFKAVRKIFLHPKWMQDKRLEDLISCDIRKIASCINKTMQRKKIKRITLCKHFPTIQIYYDFYSDIEKKLISQAAELFGVDYGYRLTAGAIVTQNAWENLPEIYRGAGINQLKDRFKGMPVIMVAGGPSLNKNIDVLKEYADRAVIICAGSTMGTLNYYGIKPHFLVIVDPFDAMVSDLEDCLNEDTYLIAPYIVSNKIIAKYPGHKMFFLLDENSPNMNALSGLKKFLPETSILHANISVAITAVSLANFIGGEPIILVGQDLAFSQGMKDHAEGSKAGDLLGKRITVPGYYGDIVETIPIFKIAIEYYASSFALMKDRLFINATEGGAYINGAVHMPLREAANKYLKNKIDVFGNLADIDNLHRNAESRELVDYLQSCIDVCTKLLDKAAETLNVTEHCPAYLLEGNTDAVRRDLDQMESFFRIILESSIYIHLIPSLHAVMELFSFQKQDGFKNMEEMFLNYAMLFAQIRNELQRLNILMKKALVDLEGEEVQ